MPLVLPDLAALCAEWTAWALLVITIYLLAKLVALLSHQITIPVIDYSFAPLGWLADALNSYVLAGAEDARAAVAGAMRDTWDGLTWSLGQILGTFTDLADATKALALYLWQHVVKPFVDDALKPIRSLIDKAESEVAALATKLTNDIAKEVARADAFGWARLADAEGFTKTEIAAARSDFTRADALIDARLDGIGTQAGTIAGDIAAAPDQVWGDLNKYLNPTDLAQATILGVLGALGIHELTKATNLDTNNCQENQKKLCNTDPVQWGKLLEGLALLGVAFDFKLLYDAAEAILTDVGDLLVKIEDVAWSEF